MTAETFESVWDALADSPEEAAIFRARSDLIHAVADAIEARGWTEREIATRCGVSRPRARTLLRRRCDRFSIDALIKISTALGIRVKITVAGNTAPTAAT